MSIINPPSWLQAGTYNARADRLGIGSAISVGGVTAPTSYAVTQTLTPSMSVQVSAGSAYVPNTFGIAEGYYAVVNDGTVTIALDASHANFNRTDLIILTVKDGQYAGTDNFAVIEKVTGSPGPGANPAPNPVPANSIILASVLVPASASSVVTSNIGTTLRAVARFQPSMTNAVQQVNSNTTPQSPTNGQLIIEEDTGKLRVNINGAWRTLSPLTAYRVTGGSRPPGAETGMIIYEEDTKRFFSFDGVKWNYAGGGGGGEVNTTFDAWNPNYRSTPGTASAGYQPLTLWKDAEGRWNLEGMVTNAVPFTGGWVQYAVYGICYLPNGIKPFYDIRVYSGAVAPNQGNEATNIMIKGSNPSSTSPGTAGIITWQPMNSKSWVIQPGYLQIFIPRVSWYTA